jgi:hypothetical protein
MTNKLLFLIILFSLTIRSHAQTEKSISVTGGNGNLILTDGFVDSYGYSVIILQFSPRSSFFILLDPEQNEISRQLVNGSELSINGFSSTSKEFIVYFNGKVTTAKSSSYFVALFKNGRTPIFSDWLDIPTINEKLFTYSFNDKFFVATAQKKSDDMKIFEVSTINNIHEKSFKVGENTIDKIVRLKYFGVNTTWGGFARFGVNTINPSQDSLRIVFLGKEESNKEKSLQIVSLNFRSNSVSEKSFLTQKYNDPAACIVGDLIFMINRVRTLNPNFSLTVASLKTLKVLKSYDLDPDLLTNQQKLGPLVELGTGKIWEEGGTDDAFKRFVKETQRMDIIGADETNGRLKLRLGGLKTIVQGQSSLYIPLIFSIGFDKDLNILWEPQDDKYFDILKDYQINIAKRTLFVNQKIDRQLNFVSTNNFIISFYYSDKTNELFISKINRE